MCERVYEKEGDREREGEGEHERTHTFSVARTNVCTHANNCVFEPFTQPGAQTKDYWDPEKNLI